MSCGLPACRVSKHHCALRPGWNQWRACIPPGLLSFARGFANPLPPSHTTPVYVAHENTAPLSHNRIGVVKVKKETIF